MQANKMADQLERVTLSTGVELEVQITGDSRNPPIILLHGFPESHRTWRGIVPDRILQKGSASSDFLGESVDA